MKNLFILVSMLLVASSAQAQTVQQSGPITPGHAVKWLTNGVIGDAGTSQTPGLTTVGIVGTGTPFCIDDVLPPSTSGYHQLCLGANSLGGGLISYNAYGGATTLPLNMNINGTNYQFPFALSGIVGPSTSVVGDIATWNNTSGTLLSDSGKMLTDFALLNSPAFTGVPTAPTAPLGTNTTQIATTAFVGAQNGAVGVNVISKGADPTGISDSTAAFAAAVSSGGYINVPCGTFKINLTLTSVNNTTISGNGPCSVIEPFASGNTLTLNGGDFNTIKDLLFEGRPGVTGNGIVETNGAGNTQLNNLIVELFTGSGVVCDGTTLNQMSGNSVTGGYFLNNTASGIQYSFCNDFHIQDNQLGMNGGDGITLGNSSSGQVKGNFSWQNTGLAVNSFNSNFNWVDSNRLTQSGQEGFACASCAHLNLTNNQFYQNSVTSIGTVPDAFITGTSGFITVEGNQFFDWTGIAHTNYGLQVDSSVEHINITGNVYDQFHTVGPTNIAAGVTDFISNNNIPTLNPTSNACAQAQTVLAGATTSSSGGGGSTVFLGAAGSNANNFNTWWVSTKTGTVCSFSLTLSAAPGAGQSYTFTVQQGGVDTGLTGTAAGSTQTVLVQDPTHAFTYNAGTGINIKVTSTAGAPANEFQYSVGVAQ